MVGIRPAEGIRIPVAEEIHNLAGEESQRSSHAKRRAEEWAGRRGRGPEQGRKEADRPAYCRTFWETLEEAWRVVGGGSGETEEVEKLLGAGARR